MTWHCSSSRLRLVVLTLKAVWLCALFSGLLVPLRGWAEQPFVDSKDRVPVQGNPNKDPRYIENAIKAVSIVGWGGPFQFDTDLSAETPSGSIFIERAAVHLDEDPLVVSSIVLDAVFRSSELARAMVTKMNRPGAYTYYIGPGGYIYPTLISETTAPVVCATLRKAIERERTNAIAARNTSIGLLVWYIGARSPVQVKLPSRTGLDAFAATEQSIIVEARRILSSSAFMRIREAQAAGKGVIVRINGRLIQYEPSAPCSGMTLFGENGFLLGREAFRSEAEVVKTLLHELHRLTTSVVQSEGVTMATVHSETQAAKVFADRAVKAVLEGKRQ
ncbi:hypothetical protein POL68_15355 [Stigmatella sp. ncwal1]|uniref:LPP20 lipoprotein n=1 Tax=Stigmatella ashevillensis TaxID=2995309 RepID=A0ABT5D889_9BACT|nr:hypothetical protein [Stigmatella ashevillena]MDC0709849.1 hypothetical protein [Stigmatella ashevillena]